MIPNKYKTQLSKKHNKNNIFDNKRGKNTNSRTHKRKTTEENRKIFPRVTKV